MQPNLISNIRLLLEAQKKAGKKPIVSKPAPASSDDRRPLPQQQPTATAKAVIAAGARRRGEVDPPKPTGLALQIVNAGRRARGEPPL